MVSSCPKRWQQPIMRDVWRFAYKNFGNCVIGITGMPNMGKSWTGDKIAYELMGPDYTISDYLCYSIEDVFRKTFAYVKFQGRPITMELIYKIEDLDAWLTENHDYITFKPGRVIMLDEAGIAAYVREFFSKDNKNLAKLLQLWRFLRMVVIIVVPGSMNLADSTVSLFMNIEIRMLGVNHGEGYAWCIAYEYIGWNQKKKEPIRRRLKGCRYNGSIKIATHDDKRAQDYERAMFHSKMFNLMSMAKEYKISKAMTVGKTRNIHDDVKYVKEHMDDFKQLSKQGSGFVNHSLIMTELQVSRNKATQIKAKVDRDLAQEREAETKAETLAI